MNHFEKNTFFLNIRKCCHLLQNILFPSLYVVHYQKKLVYILNHKSASTLILYAMGVYISRVRKFAKAAGIELNENEDKVLESKKRVRLLQDKIGIDSSGKTVWKIKHHLTREEKKYFVFSFVKNPISRFISCFYNLIWDQEILPPFFRKDKLNEENCFNMFCEYILKMPHWFSDRHFRAQYQLLGYGKNKIDFIGRVESDNDFKILEEKTGLKLKGEFNVSKASEKRNILSEGMHEKLREYYKKDFTIFNY